MTLQKLTPNVTVNDVLDSARFWCEVLGFDFVVGVPEGTQDSVFELVERPLGFAIVQSDGIEIMFQSLESVQADLPNFRLPSEGDGATMLFIELDDVEAMRERVGDRGDLVSDLRETFYGMREFVLRDPGGLVVVFAQRLAVADPDSGDAQ